MIVSSVYHTPVLHDEVLEALKVGKGKKYIDATLGGAGHAIEIVRRGGSVLGIDQDADAIRYVREKLEVARLPARQGSWKLDKENSNWEIGKDIQIVQGNFADIAGIAKRNGFEKVDGILFDLGMSSHQIDASGRGFSYRKDEPLDMRMDAARGQTAADSINRKNAGELYEIFTHYSEELNSRSIAAAIVRARTVNGPLTRTSQLVRIIESAVTDARQKQKTVARIFQALRIVTNEELDALKSALEQAIHLLVSGGTIAVISYHSLEDRIVKLTFRTQERLGYIRLGKGKIIVPSRGESHTNPRARSARMRIAHHL